MKIREYHSSQTSPQPGSDSYFQEYIFPSHPQSSFDAETSAVPAPHKKNNKPFLGLQSLKSFFSDLFLPVGYPHSVGTLYLEYQIFDTIQALCSYLRGVVSTSAVLSAAGVGDAQATAISAALAWAFRDGIGMLFGLFFSYISSSHFDSHVKEFRLFADVINDVGLTLDMITPSFPREYMIYITALATVCKVMCGMAAGATKGSITSHFAIRGNMADLNAKESTQETLATLVGMLWGIALAKKLQHFSDNDAFWVSWVVFIVLTVIHVWANYRGVKVLRLKSLNRERMECAVKRLLDVCEERYTSQRLDGNVMEEDMLNLIKGPEDVSESLFWSTWKLMLPGRIRLGVSFGEFCQGMTAKYVQDLINLEFHAERYLLNVAKHGRNTYVIRVALRCDAKEEDELKALFHALLVERVINSAKGATNSGDIHRQNQEIVKSTHSYLTKSVYKIKYADGTEKHFQENYASLLQGLLKCGWDCSRVYLGFGHWRFECVEKEE